VDTIQIGCIDDWLGSHPPDTGTDYLTATANNIREAITTEDSQHGYQALSGALETLGMWLATRLDRGAQSPLWVMDETAWRQFPDYAWPPLRTLAVLRDEVQSNTMRAMSDPVQGESHQHELPAVQQWAHQVAEEVCALLDVLRDPSPHGRG
jgi:hypothetical protein